MKTILDNTSQDEMEAGSKFSELQRNDPATADKATALCQTLGLYGFWYRVNSARWEIAKVILAEQIEEH